MVSLKAEVAALRDNTESSDQITELREKLKATEEQSNEYEQQCIANIAELDDLSKKLHSKDTELKKSLTDLTTAKDELAEKDNQLQELQIQLGQQQAELAVRQQNVGELQAQVESKKGELDDRRKSRRIADGEKDRIIQELTEKVNSISISPQSDVDVEELQNKVRRLGRGYNFFTNFIF